MGQLLTLPVTLESFDCGVCGGTYALNQRYVQKKRDDSGFWHCPYCQSDWGYVKGALQKAQEALAAEQERHRASLTRLNVAAAERDRAQRKLKRVGKGVCPECNRTFSDLARHMACKHKKVAK